LKELDAQPEFLAIPLTGSVLPARRQSQSDIGQMLKITKPPQQATHQHLVGIAGVALTYLGNSLI
jgi:hypothetical protein